MMSQPKQLELDLFDSLSDFEARVWALIQPRYGKKRAIARRSLLVALGYDPLDQRAERHLRRTIEYLVKKHGLPIGSSCDPKNHGYYHIVDPDELIEHYKFLVRCGLKFLVRASRLKKSNLPSLIGQLELELQRDGDTVRQQYSATERQSNSRA